MKRESLTTLAAAVFAGIVQFGPMATGLLLNTKFEDVGEGYKVREVCNQRVIYVGKTMGLGRFIIDEDMDGSLDRTMLNMPISPYMGGPGYRLMDTETTPEDREKFERVMYLLDQRNKV